MAIHVLEDSRSSVTLACLYDSVTDRAFGPVMYGEPGTGAEFLEWLEMRGFPFEKYVEFAAESLTGQLEELYGTFRRDEL